MYGVWCIVYSVWCVSVSVCVGMGSVVEVCELNYNENEKSYVLITHNGILLNYTLIYSNSQIIETI